MPHIKLAHATLEVVQIQGPQPSQGGQHPAAPLVFLHEGLGSVSQWSHRGMNWPQAVCLATGRAGWVYSRQGYGQSSPAAPGRHVLPADYMQREAWDVLPDVLAALRISEPVLIGHSDGATIALLYASRHPVAACIALAPHVVVEAVAIAAITAAKAAFESGDLRRRLAAHHADVDGAFWQWNDVWLSPAFSGFDIRAECRQITDPVLLMQGEDDAYGTMRQLDEIALAVPHAVQCRLPRCSHSPQRDQPEASLAAVRDFLANLSQG